MSPPATNHTPNTIAIHPGSGDFFLAEDRKKGIRIAAQIHKPTMAEKFVGAIMSGAQALKGVPPKPPILDHTPPVLARVIDPKRLGDGQHKRMADQLIRAARAARTAQSNAQSNVQSVAIMRTKGTIGLAGAVIIGSLGMAAWMWQTGGREILLEHAKAKKPKANPN